MFGSVAKWVEQVDRGGAHPRIHCTGVVDRHVGPPRSGGRCLPETR